MLLSMQDKNLAEQMEILDKNIEDWKAYTDEDGKTYEQIDDIVVIGIRI